VIRIELASIGRIGSGLQGCEGVMAARDGTQASGRPTTTPNFPFMDRKGRLWVSNSTSQAHFKRKPSPAGAWTASIGNLSGPSLPTFRVPHPGLALVHQLVAGPAARP